uniref:ATP-dependent DNA helicase PIF1 n=1 Tax=Ornithorhynchus anatinus TaxID=9258 RepID=F6R806_ORNAN
MATEQEAAEQEATELRCRVSVEELSPGGQPWRRQVLREAQLSLGRNERRELVLRLQAGAAAGPRLFPLRAARLFTRFSASGRSGLRLGPAPDSGSGSVQLLLSDCPPYRLRRFLRTLKLKLAGAPGPPTTPARARLLAPRPRAFLALSPVQLENRHQDADATLDATPRKEPGAPSFSPLQETSTPEPLRSPRPRPRLQLSREQEQVLSAVLRGKSVFFTGSAGTGKSFLMKRILGSVPPAGTVATASTGAAACLIGGTTLHGFAGIGSGQAPLEQCVARARRPGVRRAWLSCQRLVIDEISMVEAALFDKLEAVARAVRQREEPFGGIQLIICGDFLQLPPVSSGDRTRRPQFCFQARSWSRCIQVTMELTQVRRQSDPAFISLLRNVRLGRCPEEVTRQLRATAGHKLERDGVVATRLCTHQDDVETTNWRRLQELPGAVRCYEAVDSDPEQAGTINRQCPVGQQLQLKLGAQVILVKNLAVTRGLVNGARGVVVGFEAGEKGLPQVRFLCGVTEVVHFERWNLQSPGGQPLSRQQLPLRLAWALSIHKSQGMSLDCVEISLARVFESGQAYVALSRARSLQGLRVLDFDPDVVRSDPRVLRYYASLRPEGRPGEMPPTEEGDASDQENVAPDL